MKKTTMDPVFKGVLCLMAGLSSAAQAQPVWTGTYGGVGLSSARVKSSASATMVNDGQTPAVGWTDNRFRGDAYNAVDSMQAVNAGPLMGMTPSVATFGPSSQWTGQWGADGHAGAV